MITNNGEPKPSQYGTDAHDERFEGSCLLYAQHLVNEHGYSEEAVKAYKDGDSENEWIALNKLHRLARTLDN